MSAVTKVGLLLLSTAFLNFALTPPITPPSQNDRAKYTLNIVMANSGTEYIPNICRSILWSLALLESYLILSPPAETGYSLHGIGIHYLTTSESNLQKVSTPFLCGCILVALGSLGRLYCYRAMGRLFTFHLAVLPDHKLITHGPYSVVRHPSYTALIPLSIGVLLVYVGPGSLSYEIWGPRLFHIGVVLCCTLWWFLERRSRIEDRVLKREFGKEWEDWARGVRWMFIPGIF